MVYNVGITGTGSLIGQGIIKSIQDDSISEKCHLVGFDYFENTVGSFWCHKNYILPDILKSEVTEDQWLGELLETIKQERIQILFIGVDFELPILAKHRESIREKYGCEVIVSSPDVIRIGNDKFNTYEFLKEHNLYYPKTSIAKETISDEIEYPVIMKPRVGARSVGVYKIKNQNDFKDKIGKVNGAIIQELIGDDYTEYTCGILCIEGEIKGSIILNRSLKGGNTFTSEYRKDYPEIIIEYIEEIAKNLKPHGSCNLQLRLGTDGIPKLFEINPRHSGTTYMRTLFGYKEVVFLLKYYLEKTEISFDLKPGKALRFYQEKLIK
ncbi:ATP-grasp domain-containing protein [Christiangramia portivictoriae]|uniref:ATP-grasp domain-containing protein n=1 Tax=Christiangramia portivictoriae TaxID=326069 RepID=UPI00041CE73B|nr:ATP-grasp domain-containing protein [Christiangramia portivictoriae]